MQVNPQTSEKTNSRIRHQSNSMKTESRLPLTIQSPLQVTTRAHRFSEPTDNALDLQPSTAGLKLDNDGSFLTTRCCVGTAYSTSPVKQQVQLYTFHSSRQARFLLAPKTGPASAPATIGATTYRPTTVPQSSQRPKDQPTTRKSPDPPVNTSASPRFEQPTIRPVTRRRFGQKKLCTRQR